MDEIPSYTQEIHNPIAPLMIMAMLEQRFPETERLDFIKPLQNSLVLRGMTGKLKGECLPIAISHEDAGTLTVHTSKEAIDNIFSLYLRMGGQSNISKEELRTIPLKKLHPRNLGTTAMLADVWRKQLGFPLTDWPARSVFVCGPDKKDMSGYYFQIPYLIDAVNEHGYFLAAVLEAAKKEPDEVSFAPIRDVKPLTIRDTIRGGPRMTGRYFCLPTENYLAFSSLRDLLKTIRVHGNHQTQLLCYLVITRIRKDWKKRLSI